MDDATKALTVATLSLLVSIVALVRDDVRALKKTIRKRRRRARQAWLEWRSGKLYGDVLGLRRRLDPETVRFIRFLRSPRGRALMAENEQWRERQAAAVARTYVLPPSG